MRQIILSVFALLLIPYGLSTVSHAETSSKGSTDQNKYFEQRERGWFWYEVMEEPEKEEPLEQPPPPQPEITVDDIHKTGDQLLNKAIIEPTKENIHAYLVWQKFVLDRSQQFTEVWQTVIREHPELDETVNHPTSTLGVQLAAAEEKKSVKEVIEKVSEMGEILYFFTSTCPYCKEQGRLLTAFRQNYPIGIMAVSLDGQGMEGWDDYQVDQGQARNLGVDQVPALFLLIPPNTVIRVGTGLMTYDEIERRLYIVGKEVLGIKESFPSNQEYLSTITEKQAQIKLPLNNVVLPQEEVE